MFSECEALVFVCAYHREFLAGRSFTFSDEHHNQAVNIYLHQFNPSTPDDVLLVEFHKRNTTEELISIVLSKLECEDDLAQYELCEVRIGMNSSRNKSALFLGYGHFRWTNMQRTTPRPARVSDGSAVALAENILPSNSLRR